MQDALGHRKAPQKPPDAAQQLSQLGWAPRSRPTRRRERAGLWDFLRRGILIGGLVWVLWWLVTSGDQSTTPEPAADNAAVLAEPADPPVVVPVESPPDELSAPTGSGNTVAARPGDPGPAQAPVVPVISAILLSEGRRLAVVDGRVLGVGQRVGPWELVSVDRDAVVLRDASGVEQVITLDPE